MMIKREVFTKIKEMAPQLFPNIIPKNPSLPFGYFNRLNVDSGEDTSFCWRARECGFKVFVHRGAVSGHVGPMIYGPHNTAGRA